MRKVICHLAIEGDNIVACGESISKVMRADENIFLNIVDTYDEYGDTLISRTTGHRLITDHVTAYCVDCLSVLKSQQ